MKTDKIIQIGQIIDSWSWNNPHIGRIYSIAGIAPTINTMQGGGKEPIEARPKGKGWKWIPEEKCWIRLRKLTPRECFRLMGVVETDIDNIQQAVFNKNDVIPLRYGDADKEKGERSISNSQQYKMAGNSIVTNCLCEIFRKLFIEKENEQRQLELF